jgi:Na+-translocating ferredoxin:NAD+ oxidoreductase RnfG subunit
LWNAVNQKIKKADEERDALAFYKKQAEVVTDEELDSHLLLINSKKTGYYFSTDLGETLLHTGFFAPYVTGYGGPLELIVLLDNDFIIRKVHLLKHNETPEWIDKIAGWMRNLEGHLLVEQDPLKDIDGLTGATFTTGGILEALQKTGKKFHGYINGDGVVSETFSAGQLFHLQFFLLAGFTCLALLYLRNKPKKKIRILYMIVVVLVLGFWQNLQFSTYHITRLSTASVHIKGLDISSFFYVLLPVVIIFAGNIYCGYLCPFGLLQELIGEAVFVINIKIPRPVDAAARKVKYLLLVLIFLTPFVYSLKPAAGIDILLSAFNLSSGVPVAAASLLLLSAFIHYISSPLPPLTSSSL